MKLTEINSNNHYGRCLLAALTILTTENHTDKTPDQVIELLKQKANEIYGPIQPVGESPGPFGMLHLGRGSFGDAIKAAIAGKKVARTGWNGSGMFAYIVPANTYPAQTDIAKEFWGENGMVPYREYWALKTAQNDVATWAPSGSDSLANDWCIVEKL